MCKIFVKENKSCRHPVPVKQIHEYFAWFEKYTIFLRELKEDTFIKFDERNVPITDGTFKYKNKKIITVNSYRIGKFS
jgi:hypothetical protein